MQLKTVKERVLSLSNKGYGSTDLTRLTDTITQDRADIRAVLKEGVKGYRDAITSSMDERIAYNQALDDILTLIDSLLPGDTLSKVKADWDAQAENLMNGLPGDVSKPTPDIPGFEGTMEALDKLKI